MNKGTVLAMFYAYQETRETIRFLFVRWKGGGNINEEAKLCKAQCSARAHVTLPWQLPSASAPSAPSAPRERQRGSTSRLPREPLAGKALSSHPKSHGGAVWPPESCQAHTNSQLQLCFQPPRACAKYVQLQRTESVLMQV